MNLWNSARRPHFTLVVCCLLSLIPGAVAERQTLNFNPDWKFLKADPPGAQAPSFNDHNWSNVSAPHTYNEDDTYDNWSLLGHRGEQDQWSGRTWYRKTFFLPESMKGKKVYIEFEAVRQVGEVYINGQLLGANKTGFVPFGFDLTPHIKFGATNLIAVMCDNRFQKDPQPRAGGSATNRAAATVTNQAPAAAHGSAHAPETSRTNELNINPTPNPNLAAMQHQFNTQIPETLEELQPDQIPWNNPHWHPAHGGIYRNVRLYILDPLHISLPLYSYLQTAGPYVYATDISEQSARVHLEVPIANGRTVGETVELVAQVLDRQGKPVLTMKHEGQVVAGASATFSVSGQLSNPQLWEPDYPYLYSVVSSLRVNGETIDSCKVPLGVRTLRWTTNQGFFINGRHLKLRGWGQKPTDEWPGLGAAQPDWLHYYTLELMREAGGNWVRWGHCPGGPSMVQAADELGILTHQPGLDGEADTVRAAWQLRASAFRDLIIYFRNHPSIVIWEGGNQKITREHAAELRGYMDKYDPHGGRAYAHRRSDQVVGEFMDVCIGTEGGWELKQMAVVEGEYNREESPRRVWDTNSPPNFGYHEAKGRSEYVLTSEQFAVNQAAHFVRKLGAIEHSGGANWIFTDSTSGGRNAAEVCRASGEVDGVRLPKEAYYVCQVMFRSEPQVHIIGHWTYPAGTKKTVFVAANGDEVELFVNGKSIGRSSSPENRYIFRFNDVVWTPGEIKAVAYRNGKSVATHSRRTAGRPVALRIKPITGPQGLMADGSDVALFDVEVVDSKGERCPTFQQRVDFDCRGPAIWRGGYNSGKTNSINHTYLDLECGLNRVAIRSTRTPGTISVRVRAKGLRSATARVRSVPLKVQNGYSATLPAMPALSLPKERRLVADIDPRPLDRIREVLSGNVVKGLSYSGPTSGIRVEKDAANGKKIYADRDFTFASLPGSLAGADYVQAPNADRLYSAVDLMEIAVPRGSVVSIAHDDRLERPDWLLRQFKPTGSTLTVDGQTMSIFQRQAERDESLTLGSNVENPRTGQPGHMFIVLVKAP